MKIYTYCKFTDEHLSAKKYLGIINKYDKKEFFLTESYLRAFKFDTERGLKEFMDEWETLIFDKVEARDWQSFTINRCEDKRNKGQVIPGYVRPQFDRPPMPGDTFPV